ncbi:MAG: alkaline phosphatase family protein [Actinomycetota bacterium]|nr:alkaline phosphatase family protein [Actinomycetota bacterium]
MIKRTWGVVLALALVAAACTGSDDKGGAKVGSTSPTPPPTDFASPVAVETDPAPEGDWLESACDLPRKDLEIIGRGYFEGRSPEITILPREPNFFGSFTANSHSGPWDYVQRVPIIFYGPGFIQAQGEINPDRPVTSADIAPTIAELVGMEWPSDRPSSALSEALVPAAERPDPPKLVLMVVWDGGGRNVLEQWPQAWPNLRSMIQKGTSFGNAIVGSSPSVTPAVHATIGTGTFPDQHGIVDIPLRVDGEMVGSWPDSQPTYLEVESMADLYDRANGNQPLVGMVGDHGWHLGMIGHGSYLEGADQDYAVMFSRGGHPITNEEHYQMPPYIKEIEGLEDDIRTVDVGDGEADGRWMGNDVLDEGRLIHETPPATLFQTRVIRELMTNEGFGQDDIPDLLFTNYKQIDYVGHRFNMLQPEMREVVRYSDQELGELEDFLNEFVGENEWVIGLSADHGSTPSALATEAWPISTDELEADMSEHFGIPVEDLVDDTRVTGFWMNRETLEANDISLEEVSDFLLDMRIEDNNVVPVEDLPEGYAQRLDEHIFSAVFPSEQTDAILECAGVKL